MSRECPGEEGIRIVGGCFRICLRYPSGVPRQVQKEGPNSVVELLIGVNGDVLKKKRETRGIGDSSDRIVHGSGADLREHLVKCPLRSVDRGTAARGGVNASARGSAQTATDCLQECLDVCPVGLSGELAEFDAPLHRYQWKESLASPDMGRESGYSL